MNEKLSFCKNVWIFELHKILTMIQFSAWYIFSVCLFYIYR